jgi:DNA-binding CsgD family transcriptional regulator
MFRGERARGAGWFARAERLLESSSPGCVERGYLMIPRWLEAMARGDFERGSELTAEAAAIGKRCNDPDLVWLSNDDRARSLLNLGRDEEASRLLDEALVAAVAGELSPIVTGIVFCNTIAFCRTQFALHQLREWTHALNRWCERQPEMVAHNGLCLVHRAELFLLEGKWTRGVELAREMTERFSRGVLNQLALGEAFYCVGEAERLRGDFDAAEEAYRRASEAARDPQPGLALLRLMQDKKSAAEATIRRVVAERTMPLQRARMLPAYVEIMLAVGRLELARAGARELGEIAAERGREALEAMAAHAQGAVALAEGRATDALADLRRAWKLWGDVDARHEIARIRARVGLACRALGDEDSARLELDAARKTFEELGAVPELAWLDTLDGSAAPAPAHGLTSRELEVLRHLAAGKTNRQIASELFISEHTVARHVQNIFTKLAVSTRTEAASYAFSHDLV